jgi:hypothetical protein
MSSVVTDGTKAMLDTTNGFVGLLRQNLFSVVYFTILSQ